MSRFAPGGGRVVPTPGGGTGDVVGPASATSGACAVFGDTTGKLIANSSVTIIGNQLLAPSGTAGAPSLAVGAAGVGVYSSGANALSLATNSVSRVTVNTANVTSALPFIFAAGTVSAPGIASPTDNTSGFYSGGGGEIDLSYSGVKLAAFTSGTVTVSGVVVAAQGSVAAPAFATGQTTNGMYSPLANQLAFAVNSTQLALMTQTALTSTVPVVAPAQIAGTTSSYGFTGSNAGTGLHTPSADVVALSISGTDVYLYGAGSNRSTQPLGLVQGSPGGATGSVYFQNAQGTGFCNPGGGGFQIFESSVPVLTCATAAITAAAPVSLQLGGNANPSLFFAGSPTTGIYSGGSNVFNIVSNSTTRVVIDSTASTIYSPANQTLTVSDTAVTSTVPVVLPAGGTQAVPALAATPGDLDTGFYGDGSGGLWFTSNGTARVTLATLGILCPTVGTGVYARQPQINQYGTVGSPTSISGALPNLQYNDFGTTVQSGYKLPASSPGLVYEILSTTAFGTSIVTNGGGDSFNIGGVIPAGSVTTLQAGASIRFTCLGTVWYGSGIMGTWAY